MGDITVRRLNDTIVKILADRAKIAGRSIEDEARALLEEATRETVAALDRAEQRAFIKRLQRHRKDIFGDQQLAPGSVSRFLEGDRSQPKPARRVRVLDEA